MANKIAEKTYLSKVWSDYLYKILASKVCTELMTFFIIVVMTYCFLKVCLIKRRNLPTDFSDDFDAVIQEIGRRKNEKKLQKKMENVSKKPKLVKEFESQNSTTKVQVESADKGCQCSVLVPKPKVEEDGNAVATAITSED